MKTFDHHEGLGGLVPEIVVSLHRLCCHRHPPLYVATHHSLQIYSICAMFFYQNNFTNLGTKMTRLISRR